MADEDTVSSTDVGELQVDSPQELDLKLKTQDHAVEAEDEQLVVSEENGKQEQETEHHETNGDIGVINGHHKEDSHNGYEASNGESHDDTAEKEVEALPEDTKPQTHEETKPHEESQPYIDSHAATVPSVDQHDEAATAGTPATAHTEESAPAHKEPEQVVLHVQESPVAQPASHENATATTTTTTTAAIPTHEHSNADKPHQTDDAKDKEIAQLKEERDKFIALLHNCSQLHRKQDYKELGTLLANFEKTHPNKNHKPQDTKPADAKPPKPTTAVKPKPEPPTSTKPTPVTKPPTTPRGTTTTAAKPPTTPRGTTTTTTTTKPPAKPTTTSTNNTPTPSPKTPRGSSVQPPKPTTTTTSAPSATTKPKPTTTTTTAATKPADKPKPAPAAPTATKPKPADTKAKPPQKAAPAKPAAKPTPAKPAKPDAAPVAAPEKPKPAAEAPESPKAPEPTPAETPATHEHAAHHTEEAPAVAAQPVGGDGDEEATF